MAIEITVFDEAGAPLVAGLTLELVAGGVVVGEAVTDDDGHASFDVAAAGRELAVRVRVGDAFVAKAPPAAATRA